MASLESELSLDRLAALHEGLAHPARVAILRALRDAKGLAPAALRARLAEAGIALDATGLRFHLRRMEQAGLVDVGRNEVALLLDVAIRLRQA